MNDNTTTDPAGPYPKWVVEMFASNRNKLGVKAIKVCEHLLTVTEWVTQNDLYLKFPFMGAHSQDPAVLRKQKDSTIRKIRSFLNEASNVGIPIMSCRDGYRFPMTQEEHQEHAEQFSRASLANAAGGLKTSVAKLKCAGLEYSDLSILLELVEETLANRNPE